VFDLIAAGEPFVVMDLNDLPDRGDKQGVGIMVQSPDGRWSHKIPFVTSGGDPMPSTGFALLAIATMVCKAEGLARMRSDR
jgi:hypothetical protein